MDSGVTAVCRRCGGKAAADKFKLHYIYKMMVCPGCFSGKSTSKEEAAKKKEQQPPRPAGWDSDDDYLEKANKSRQEEIRTDFSRIPGSDQVRCTCAHCKYVFKFDPVRQTPTTCPYCNIEVPKFKSSYF
ncbi:TPA: hypothetical protein HA241_01145 [Candidatus Woesearchaeota archaeon]|nr:hypothetical protein [Candidatus Woesearchaeota archaeon]